MVTGHFTQNCDIIAAVELKKQYCLMKCCQNIFLRFLSSLRLEKDIAFQTRAGSVLKEITSIHASTRSDKFWNYLFKLYINLSLEILARFINYFVYEFIFFSGFSSKISATRQILLLKKVLSDSTHEVIYSSLLFIMVSTESASVGDVVEFVVTFSLAGIFKTACLLPREVFPGLNYWQYSFG